MFVAVIAATCAPQEVVTTNRVQLAHTDSIPPGLAALVILNDSGFTLLKADQEITDRNQRIASLSRQTYLRLAILPGSHELRPWPPAAGQVVRLNAEPGHTYYVVVAYRPAVSWLFPFAGAPLVIEQLSDVTALRLMQEMIELQP